MTAAERSSSEVEKGVSVWNNDKHCFESQGDNENTQGLVTCSGSQQGDEKINTTLPTTEMLVMKQDSERTETHRV